MTGRTGRLERWQFALMQIRGQAAGKAGQFRAESRARWPRSAGSPDGSQPPGPQTANRLQRQPCAQGSPQARDGHAVWASQPAIRANASAMAPAAAQDGPARVTRRLRRAAPPPIAKAPGRSSDHRGCPCRACPGPARRAPRTGQTERRDSVAAGGDTSGHFAAQRRARACRAPTGASTAGLAARAPARRTASTAWLCHALSCYRP